MRVIAFNDDLVSAVKEFNVRLALGGSTYRFPELPSTSSDSEAAVTTKQFVAVDDTGAVRGGYNLRLEKFKYRNGSGIVGFCYLPLSEGIIDPKYAMVGVQLLIDCLRRQPCLYCLGIGGAGEALALMLKHAGFRIQEVPFYFRIMRPQSFLQHIEYLRSRPKVRLVVEFARWTGIGYAILKPWALATSGLRKIRPRTGKTTAREVAAFETWADMLWEAASIRYDFVIWRNSEALRRLYPSNDQRFVRVLVERDREPVGWAVVIITNMREHKQFGNMRVGSLVDVFALDGYERAVVDHATDLLESRAVDLIVSNQSYSSWRASLLWAGYCRGPSNFLFATSKVLEEHTRRLNNCHVTRGDGDGPINL